jgi:hypothetical protein
MITTSVLGVAIALLARSWTMLLGVLVIAQAIIIGPFWINAVDYGQTILPGPSAFHPAVIRMVLHSAGIAASIAFGIKQGRRNGRSIRCCSRRARACQFHLRFRRNRWATRSGA